MIKEANKYLIMNLLFFVLLFAGTLLKNYQYDFTNISIDFLFLTNLLLFLSIFAGGFYFFQYFIFHINISKNFLNFLFRDEIELLIFICVAVTFNMSMPFSNMYIGYLLLGMVTGTILGLIRKRIELE